MAIQYSSAKRPYAPIVPTSNMRAKRRTPPANPNTLVDPSARNNQNTNIAHAPNGAPSVGGGNPSAPFVGESGASIGSNEFNGAFAPGNTTGEAPRPANDNMNVSGGGTGQSSEDMAMQAIKDLLSGGPRDTSEEEAYIQQMLAQTVGQGQADLNARLGAAGFGTSGAAGALSGDMRRRAALDATGQIMDVRQGARDEYLNRVMAGLESEFKDRGLDMSEVQYQNYIDAIKALLDDNGNTSENSNVSPDQFVADEEAADRADEWWNGTNAQNFTPPPSSNGFSDYPPGTVSMSKPYGATKENTLSGFSDQFDVYYTGHAPNQVWYYVPKGTI